MFDWLARHPFVASLLALGIILGPFVGFLLLLPLALELAADGR